MKLYQIAKDLEHVINGGFVIDELTGEVLFDGDNLDELNVAFEEKMEACGVVVKDMLADAEAMKHERKVLSERIERLERRAEELKGYMAHCLELAGLKSVSTPRAEVRTRRSSAVSITDEKALPAQFIRTEEVHKVDKQAIGKALKGGADVPGAELEERTSLTVR